MFRPASFRSIVHIILAAVILSAATSFLTPGVSLAAINEISVSINGPTPNPIPAGTTATVSADFWLSGDTGPITVGLWLNSNPGFGSISIDTVTSELTNCQSTPTTLTCDWDGDSADSPQTISATLAVAGDAEPYAGGQIEATAESDTESLQTYASTWAQAGPPIGKTSLSGKVITVGEVPVPEACVFVLSSTGFVFPAITDADGNWSVTDLPDEWSFAIGAIPPFIGEYGPCAEDGPPPAPAPGELQPEFYGGIWIDLVDPELTGGLGNPFGFAVTRGAVAFTDSTSGIVSCLTTASSSTVPRPVCSLPDTTTSSTTSSTMGSTTSSPSGAGVGGVSPTTTADTLPVTGASTTSLGVIGALLVLLGVGVLRATRPDVHGTSQG